MIGEGTVPLYWGEPQYRLAAGTARGTEPDQAMTDGVTQAVTIVFIPVHRARHEALVACQMRRSNR